MTRDEIERLRQLQSAATPGERHRVNGCDGAPYPEIDRGTSLTFKTFSADPQGMLPAIIVVDEFLGFDQPLADAELVQAMTPDMVGRLLDAAEAHLDEQSRIDAAVAKERERCAAIADKHAAFAGLADSHIAEVAEDSMREIAREIAAAIRTPTPTTEEGA